MSSSRTIGGPGSSIAWYISRLRMMSLEEIVTMRLYRALRDAAAGSGLGPKTPDALSLNVSAYAAGDRARFLEYFPDSKAAAIRDAECILDNKISVFNQEIDFGETIDWNTDFVTKRKWPRASIDYRFAEIGDPKDIWELNRHQFLPALGQAFLFTADERYARKALSLIESWIDQNPPSRGINWASGIELALRQISWLWTLKYVSGSACLSEMLRAKIARSLFTQTRHIARNLSLHSSANNHLIAELAAMTVVGGALGQEAWVKEAEIRFEAEIDRQIRADGVGAEQSPSYQAHSMEYYLLSYLASGRSVPEGIRKGLDRGAAFLQSVLDPTGDPAHAGDDDSGEVLRLSPGYANCKTILNLTAWMTGNDAFLQENVRRDEKAFWLLGAEAFSSLIRRERGRKPAPDAPRAFKDGGYYILEKVLGGRSVKVVFDCGPLGMRPMAGHGHADALSFALYLDGAPVLIDPGTYTYYKKGAWRDYFRGTSAHNTMRMDGRDQSIFGGLFLALKQAEAGCDEWTEGEKVSGWHSGYGKPGNPALHRRSLSFDGARAALTVEDRIETSGEHLVELFFHLDGRCIPSGPVDGRFSIATPSGTVTVDVDQRLDTTVYFGDDVLPLGWQSPSYGKREKIFTLVGRRRIRAPEAFTTRIGF